MFKYIKKLVKEKEYVEVDKIIRFFQPEKYSTPRNNHKVEPNPILEGISQATVSMADNWIYSWFLEYLNQKDQFGRYIPVE